MDTIRLMDILIDRRTKQEELRKEYQALMKQWRDAGYFKDIGYQLKTLELTKIAGRVDTYSEIISLINWDDWALDIAPTRVKDTTVSITIPWTTFSNILHMVEDKLESAKEQLKYEKENKFQTNILNYEQEVKKLELMYKQCTENKVVNKPNGD